MPALFWIDVAVFMAVQFLWGFTYMGMRFTLWLRVGNPQFLAEWNALFLFVTGFCLLAFSAFYVEHPNRRPIWGVLAGAAATIASLPLLFHGRIVCHIRLHPNGTAVADVSRSAAGFTVLLFLTYIWTFVLFWKERKRPGSAFMAYSVLALLIGFLIKGIMEVPFPILSFAHSISIGVLGYVVLNHQLFNPLRQVTDNLKREILERHRVQSMAMIHEMLYRTPNFSNIPFGEYVRKLVRSLDRSYGTGSRKVRFIMRSGDLPLDLNKSIPCGLIINEIVSNALKHAFPASFKGKPAISISMHANPDGCMVLTIRDNGTGLSLEALSGRSGSLGMRLIRILALDQLEGTVRVENRKGTAYRITFPIA
jgi:two-component sensor histidine kinase